MAYPVNGQSDYLEFECEKCKNVFHHAIRIIHDASAQAEAAKLDFMSWIIMRIELKCPKCGAEEFLKIALVEDPAREKSGK